MHVNKKTIGFVTLLLCFCMTAFGQETTPSQAGQPGPREANEKPAATAEQKAAEQKEVLEPKLELPGVNELAALGRPLSKFVPESVSAAMKLRESLLVNSEARSRAKAIQELSVSFAAIYGAPKRNNLPPDLRALFDFSGIDFEASIRGTESCPNATETFGPFTGEWYGRWAEMEVDHHWSRVIKPNEHSFTADFPDFQVGWQYAWIGDGYGVNHCLGFEEQSKTKRFILGYTEHLEGGNFEKIVARRPHVGIYAGPGKLIWITAREVFFEETHLNKDGELESYSIIGFNYVQESRDGKELLVVRDGFVAEYSTDSRLRVPFVSLALGDSVDPPEIERANQSKSGVK